MDKKKISQHDIEKIKSTLSETAITKAIEEEIIRCMEKQKIEPTINEEELEGSENIHSENNYRNSSCYMGQSNSSKTKKELENYLIFVPVLTNVNDKNCKNLLSTLTNNQAIKKHLQTSTKPDDQLEKINSHIRENGEPIINLNSKKYNTINQNCTAENNYKNGLDLLQSYCTKKDLKKNYQYVDQPNGDHRTELETNKNLLHDFEPNIFKNRNIHNLEDDLETKFSNKEASLNEVLFDEEELQYQNLHLKTRFCFNFLNGTICPYGTKCRFAHGTNELRKLKTFKVIRCRNDLNGFCRYGRSCRFIHMSRENSKKHTYWNSDHCHQSDSNDDLLSSNSDTYINPDLFESLFLPPKFQTNQNQNYYSNKINNKSYDNDTYKCSGNRAEDFDSRVSNVCNLDKYKKNGFIKTISCNPVIQTI